MMTKFHHLAKRMSNWPVVNVSLLLLVIMLYTTRSRKRLQIPLHELQR